MGHRTIHLRLRSSSYLYQNLRNGLAEGDSANQASIHFTEIPSFDEALIDEDIMQTVERM